MAEQLLRRWKLVAQHFFTEVLKRCRSSFRGWRGRPSTQPPCSVIRRSSSSSAFLHAANVLHTPRRGAHKRSSLKWQMQRKVECTTPDTATSCGIAKSDLQEILRYAGKLGHGSSGRTHHTHNSPTKFRDPLSRGPFDHKVARLRGVRRRFGGVPKRFFGEISCVRRPPKYSGGRVLIAAHNHGVLNSSKSRCYRAGHAHARPRFERHQRPFFART